MEATFHAEGIVLARTPLGEVDDRVLIYSKYQGLLELKVRGARKPKSKMSAHFEPMNTVELMVIKGRQGDYAAGVVSRDCRRRLKADWFKLVYAGKLIAACKTYLRPEEPDEEIFNFLDDYLIAIDKLTGAPNYFYEALTIATELKILSALGYSADPEFCQLCSSALTGRSAFQSPSGEIICSRCRDLAGGQAAAVSPAVLSMLTVVYQTSPIVLGKTWRPNEDLVTALQAIKNNLLYYHQ